jgi:hypothetical protein
VLNTTSPTIWGYRHIVTLEERIGKARSSMALRTYLMSFSIRAYPHKMEENLFFNLDYSRAKTLHPTLALKDARQWLTQLY